MANVSYANAEAAITTESPPFPSHPESSTPGIGQGATQKEQGVSDLDLAVDPDPVSQATLDVITDVITCHVIPAIGSVGVVGCILTLVLLVMQKRGQPMNVLLLTLAAVDACYLVLENLDLVSCLLRHQGRALQARNFSILTLPHVLWVGVTLSRVSSALTVVIAVERCLAVMFPLKMKVWVTSQTIYVTTALACVVPVVAHIPVFMRGEIQWLLNRGLNVTLPYLKLTQFAIDNAHFLDLYKNLVLNVLFRYVAMATVSVCTGMTIVQLRRCKQWRQSSAHSGLHNARRLSARDARVSVTLMHVCLVFIVCSIPGCVMLTARLIQPEFDFYGQYSRSFLVTKEVNELFLTINSSVNFIIYMRGGDEFRRNFCKICQKTLPACCSRCLFRCVMRTTKLPEAAGSDNQSRSREAPGAKDGRKNAKAASTMVSATDASQWSEASASEAQRGEKAGVGGKKEERKRAAKDLERGTTENYI